MLLLEFPRSAADVLFPPPLRIDGGHPMKLQLLPPPDDMPRTRPPARRKRHCGTAGRSLVLVLMLVLVRVSDKREAVVVLLLLLLLPMSRRRRPR